MTLLSIGVAFLPSRLLARSITTFLIVQQFALAGVDGSKDAPQAIRKEMGTFFTWSVREEGKDGLSMQAPFCSVVVSSVYWMSRVNFVNFDIALLRVSLCHSNRVS